MLGLALACGTVAPRSSAVASPPQGKGQAAPARAKAEPEPSGPLYNSSRSFQIPVNVLDSERKNLKEIQLLASGDSGYTWKVVARKAPDSDFFTYKAERDAEYWFAVRVQYKNGKFNPDKDSGRINPGLKVVIDTVPPTIVLDPQPRRGSMASVRWEVTDDNIDLASLAVDYQVAGAREWRQAPIGKRGRIGAVTWDAHTAEPLNVRATIRDRARNQVQASLELPDGTPSQSSADAGDPAEVQPAPFLPISSGPEPVADPPGRPSTPDPDPYPRNPATAPNRAAPPARPAGGGSTLLVPSPKFNLKYEVSDAGPNGPAHVVLWATQDQGRTWSRMGEDPDRVSPFPVDLGGEGTFGLCLSALSANGLGDPEPVPGDPPHLWVDVDAKKPVVELDPPPKVAPGGTKLIIHWRVNELRPGPRPIVISYRAADRPGGQWEPIADHLEDTGEYAWAIPNSIPPRFHIRVDARDAAGNIGFAETAEPVVVDRARPRSRIIGLDSAAGGPSGPTRR